MDTPMRYTVIYTCIHSSTCALRWYAVLVIWCTFVSGGFPLANGDNLLRVCCFRCYGRGFALFEYIHECIIHLSIVFWYDIWNLYTPNRHCIYNFAENIKKQFHRDLDFLSNAGATLDFWMMLVQHLNDDSCSAVCEHHLDQAASYHREFSYPPHLEYFTMALS